MIHFYIKPSFIFIYFCFVISVTNFSFVLVAMVPVQSDYVISKALLLYCDYISLSWCKRIPAPYQPTVVFCDLGRKSSL